MKSNQFESSNRKNNNHSISENNSKTNYSNQNKKDFYEDLKNSLNFKELYLSLNDECNNNNIDKILDEINNKFVGEYAYTISSSQLRNIFHKIKNVNEIIELKLLRPNLAYIAARQQDKGKARNAIKFIDELIKEVDNDTNLEGFKKFMEIVVAYHKYHTEIKK